MRLDTGQHMRMEQRMKLAPRMIQSMEILQLPALALEERIEQELASNPTLELRENDLDLRELELHRLQEQRDASEGERQLVVDAAPAATPADGANRDDFERLSNLSEEYSEFESNSFETGEPYRPVRHHEGERDAKLDAMANTAARPASLHDQLLDQWSMVECSPLIRQAGAFLIGYIDADGYLRQDLADLLPDAPPAVSLAELEQALTQLQQSLDPPGLAARDLRECLLLQIDAVLERDDEGDAGDLTTARLLVSSYLKDIEINRLPRIARETGMSVEQIKQAISQLRRFDPHPGRRLASENLRTITPDAIVEFDEVNDRYVARLTNDRLPSLTINRHYLKMARDPQYDRRTRDFVGHNLRSARWLMEAIEQRCSTLLRVINVVLEAQRDYFDFGPEHLKPLPMTQVADQLGIHVATVSRAVSEKYLQTPRGIVPLRMFFSGGTETESGDSMSWTAVQAKLEQVIASEDKSNPLNDDELVDKLKAMGIDIARRTVAKYRKQLNIPAAKQRKQF